MKIRRILAYKKVILSLQKRNLILQYQKAKKLLLSGHTKSVDFKLRKPRNKEIYSFRINKKYRALCFFNDEVVKVFFIDDHQ